MKCINSSKLKEGGGRDRMGGMWEGSDRGWVKGRRSKAGMGLAHIVIILVKQR